MAPQGPASLSSCGGGVLLTLQLARSLLRRLEVCISVTVSAALEWFGFQFPEFPRDLLRILGAPLAERLRCFARGWKKISLPLLPLASRFHRRVDRAHPHHSTLGYMSLCLLGTACVWTSLHMLRCCERSCCCWPGFFGQEGII